MGVDVDGAFKAVDALVQAAGLAEQDTKVQNRLGVRGCGNDLPKYDLCLRQSSGS